MDTKKCTKCGECKSLDEFGQKTKTVRQSACKSCQRAISAAWYAANKERQLYSVYRNNSTTMEMFNRWKATQKCQMCPESRPPCFDFHHVDQATKDFEIATAARSYGRKRLVTELRKCVCLCANCHRLVHSGDLMLPTNINRVTIEISDLLAVA